MTKNNKNEDAYEVFVLRPYSHANIMNKLYSIKPRRIYLRSKREVDAGQTDRCITEDLVEGIKGLAVDLSGRVCKC
jgi:hypothetical protein